MNETVEEETSPPLDLDPNEIFEAHEEILPYAEEDWKNPEKIENPKNMEPVLPFSMQTRQSDRTRNAKKNYTYGEDFVEDRSDKDSGRIG